MKIYVLIAHDTDWYSFDSYLGAFRTKEEAQKFIDNDYWINDVGEKFSKHDEYEIIKEEI